MSLSIITGILGQDGRILSQILSEEKKVVGVVSTKTNDDRIDFFLNQNPNVEIVKLDLTNYDSVKNLIEKYNPDNIINFAGITNTFDPWNNIDELYNLNCKIPQNFLKCIVEINPKIFFIQSSSSLMYGRSVENIINENSKTSPLYPYGITKLFSHNLINEYRYKFNLKCSSSIFFNHESFYRGENFLSKKVSNAVSKILIGNEVKLNLNSLDSFRDISHAEDFMYGIKLVCDNKINEDFIFSSNSLIKIESFVGLFFKLYGLDFEKYVTIEKENKRYDDFCLIGDNTKLKSIGWKPKHNIESLIKDMINKELDALRTI